MGVLVYMDTVLVPLSLFLMIGYHVYLWHFSKNYPSQTTIGINSLRRKAWILLIKEGDDKKGMLALQTLRNTQMTTIFTATVAILLNTSLAALTNNSYNATHLLSGDFFGSHPDRIHLLKFGSASLFLLLSFLCCSLGLCFLVDSNFLLTVVTPDDYDLSSHKQAVLERGFALALIGNRLLFITGPLLVWMLSPIPVALSSVALVLVLYELDFSPGNVSRSKFDL